MYMFLLILPRSSYICIGSTVYHKMESSLFTHRYTVLQGFLAIALIHLDDGSHYGGRFVSSQWHHNGRDRVSNHRHLHCLLNRLFRRVRGIHRSSVDSPHKGPVTRKMFPFDDVIMRKSILHIGIMYYKVSWQWPWSIGMMKPRAHITVAGSCNGNWYC